MSGHRSAQVRGLVVSLFLCVGSGALIGLLTSGGDSPWYHALAKPSWTPPSAVFAPVWTTLYIAMGVAAWRVWRTRTPGTRGALVVFAVQLGLNLAWSPLFFAWQQVGWALADIVLLWIAIGGTVRRFAGIDRPAAWLLVPYWAWVTFATALNAAIYRLQ